MFVDVHSHIVPSGDDGVTSKEEGLELVHEAGERGTSVVFATPHVWPQLELTPAREAAIRAAHGWMAERAREWGVDLRLGFELTPAPSLLEDDLSRYRLGGTDAVLMELPFEGPLALAERVAGEIEAAGLTPVLGHPERSESVIGDGGRARELAVRGWLLQVNATSLLGYHGARAERAGWWLLGEGLADLVASDGHRRLRPPFLDGAYDAVVRRLGPDVARLLFDGSALGVGREAAAHL